MAGPVVSTTPQAGPVAACSAKPPSSTKRSHTYTKAALAEGPAGEKPPDRTKLAEEMLQNGFVQSYVDFFYLTHRPDPQELAMAEGAAGEGQNVPDIQVPPDEMVWRRRGR